LTSEGQSQKVISGGVKQLAQHIFFPFFLALGNDKRFKGLGEEGQL
jgi:hypothetical protein